MRRTRLNLQAAESPTTRRQNGPERVVAFVRGLIEQNLVGPGDRLPPERELVRATGLGRSTVRGGLQALNAMGVVESRHGSGNYISGGPPRLASQPLSFLEALHGLSCDDIYEARRILEVDAAGLAAERATRQEIAALGAHVARQARLIDDPEAFLTHDIAFHRMLSAACRNPILATLVEMVSGVFYERRRESAALAPPAARRKAADAHRRIFMAVRSRKVTQARRSMHEHIVQAARAQAGEARLAVPGPQSEAEESLPNMVGKS